LAKKIIKQIEKKVNQMIEKKMGLVIRTAFNNQGWAGRCKNPLSDARCFKCRQGGLYINKGNPIVEEDEHGCCKGEPEDYPLVKDETFWCWEQVLCKKYFWGNVKVKWRYVFVGMPVYFVYPEVDSTLTLWGHSLVDRIDNGPDEYPPIFFKPFKPLPEERWAKGLNGEKITGKKWGQLHFRYLDERHERYLASLVEGKEHGRREVDPPSIYDVLNIRLKRDIIEKIEKISRTEGREPQELIREAVAKLIRERGQ
jgi:hypothetical protein